MGKNDVSAFTQATGAGSTGGAQFAGSAFVERFLRRGEVCEMTTIPASTLTEYCKQSIFPKPFKLNPSESAKHGSAVWKLSEVLSWMESRPRAE